MTDQNDRMCVLLPCGAEQNWAVPQSCLAEILTLQAAGDSPPNTVSWREQEVPVLDFGAAGSDPWLNSRTGTGLVVVILGVSSEEPEYWGLAIRGHGLAVRHILEEDCEDCPAEVQEYALAAFAMEGTTYQVPDLPLLQQRAVQADTAISA